MSTVTERFAPLFQPACIAVVGASATGISGGNRFIRNLRKFGYAGQIVPIHPTAREVEGLAACASLADSPQAVDYAYVAVPAAAAAQVLRSSGGKVRFAQVMSSGFGESEQGAALESDLLAAARAAGIRLIGPNCLGIHSTAARVTFTENAVAEAGPVGIVCQSGGLGIDILRRGQSRGLRFSGMVTIGNACDVGAAELVEYFLEDEHTRVIGLYLEGTREGRRLFEVLRQARARKPIVLLKGGRTSQGQRAAASHTGALAGNERAWLALCRQAGMPLADTLDEFLDALVALQCLQPRTTPSTRAALFGNGGGTSVLATDAFDRAGFSVPAFEPIVRDSLGALGLPAGSSWANPIDVPAGALHQDEGRVAERIMATVAQTGAADVLVIHVNMAVLLGYRQTDMLGTIMRAVLRLREVNADGMHIALVLRSDGDSETEERKRDHRLQAVAAGVPVFDELAQAARGLAAVRTIEAFREGAS